MDSSHSYDDIINHPRPISTKHPPMTPLARAAIFSPYAALTGFESQIIAAQHHRCNRIILTEEEQRSLNTILSRLKKHDNVSITYFLYAPGSDGQGGMAEGEYLEVNGTILEITSSYKTLRVGNNQTWVDIHFEDIHEIIKH